MRLTALAIDAQSRSVCPDGTAGGARTRSPDHVRPPEKSSAFLTAVALCNHHPDERRDQTPQVGPVIGIDTNVLVRYIAQDDERQAAKAARLIEQQCSETRPAFIAVLVLCELAWVLEDCYKARRSDIIGIVERVLRTKQFVVESAETVWKALRLFEANRGDFADCLIDRIGAAHDPEFAGVES